jgi:hypothetical protein
VIVDDDDLVQAILDSLSSSWETFLSNVSGREFSAHLRGYGMISSRRRVAQLPGASQRKKSTQLLHQDSKERRKTVSRKALKGRQTTKVHSKEIILMHLRLNDLVLISWVIFLNIFLERNIQGKGNIMSQLLRMMNPKEIKKFLRMRKKIEKNITWFLPYPVQFSWG